jgi:hypothetical protein
MRMGIHRSNFGLVSSAFYALIILGQFLFDQLGRFDPHGDLLARCVGIVAIISGLYIATQMEAIVRRVENDSRDVSRDTIFSMLPLLALVIGSLLKIFFYFAYAPRPPVGFGFSEMGAWLGGIFGFWTELEWWMIALVLIATMIDIIQFSNATNRITAAARSESRTVG